MKHFLRNLLVALTLGALATFGLAMPAQAAPVTITSSPVAQAAPTSTPTALEAKDRAKKPKPAPKFTPTYQAFDVHWWGWSHNFGPVGAARIAFILGSGGGAAGVVGAICSGTIVGIPCAVAAAVAAALAGMGSGWVSYCNRRGTGFTIAVPWGGIPTCEPR